MNDSGLLIVLSVTVGGILLIWNGNRRFKRLNQTGAEQFASYQQKIGARFLDVLMLGGGYGLLGAAALISLVEYAQPFLSLMLLLAFIWVIQKTCSKSKK